MAMKLVNGRIVHRKTLPVTNCDDCGACCRHMGTPPGYAAYYPVGGDIAAWAKESPDYERWLRLPPEVEAELRAYYDGVKAGTIFDRTNDFTSNEDVTIAIKEGKLWLAEKTLLAAAARIPIPCLWYDENTKGCKHYEHRPETCRDEVMVPGNDACLATRAHFRIPLPEAR